MTSRPELGKRRATIAALLALAGLALIGVAAASVTAGHDVGAVPLVNRGVLSSPPRSQSPTSAAPIVRATLLPGSRLIINRLHTDAAVVGVVAVHGVMQIPRDPSVLGWWSGGAAPGARRGHVVVVGHVNFAGERGALAALPQLRPGDTVMLGTAQHRSHYVVTALRSYPKSSGLPAAIFAKTGAEQLVLITCGGPFDAASGNYEDNIVAYADPVPDG